MTTEKEANRKAEILKTQLKGDGWTIRVWENIGWHYSLHNCGLSLMEEESVERLEYWCLLASDLKYTGSGEIYWAEEESDRFHFSPHEAIEAQLKLAEEYLFKFMQNCDEAVFQIRRNIDPNPSPTVKNDVIDSIMDPLTRYSFTPDAGGPDPEGDYISRADLIQTLNEVLIGPGKRETHGKHHDIH